jgi:hypothetical protein
MVYDALFLSRALRKPSGFGTQVSRSGFRPADDDDADGDQAFANVPSSVPNDNCGVDSDEDEVCDINEPSEAPKDKVGASDVVDVGYPRFE